MVQNEYALRLLILAEWCGCEQHRSQHRASFWCVTAHAIPRSPKLLELLHTITLLAPRAAPLHTQTHRAILFLGKLQLVAQNASTRAKRALSHSQYSGKSHAVSRFLNRIRVSFFLVCTAPAAHARTLRCHGRATCASAFSRKSELFFGCELLVESRVLTVIT